MRVALALILATLPLLAHAAAPSCLPSVLVPGAHKVGIGHTFGALPTTPASGLGFIADNLHANDAAYDAAGAAIASNLLPQLSTM